MTPIMAGPPPAAPAVVPEEIYGPDHPLTQDDVPVIENGVCRVRYEKAQAAFSLDLYTGAYVEAGRFTFWRDSPAGTEARYTALIKPVVLEWTPERAVIGAVFGIGATDRCAVYITLQRGWSGPRVEAYATWSTAGTKPGVAIRFVPFTAGATTLGRSSGTVAIVDATDYGTLAALEPWLYLLGTSPNLALHLAALQAVPKIIGRSDTAAYGSARTGISFSSQLGSTAAGYVSATLGVGARGSETAAAQNLGRTNLIDSQAVPELVAR